MNPAKKAIVLLSGGLDSAVTLYYARQKGFDCRCLVFDYAQRHRREIKSAKAVAKCAKCGYEVVKFSLSWGGSSLLDRKMKIHQVAKSSGHRVTSMIPNTYVPARNIIFLSFALSYAEASGARAIFIGAHAQDYSGYPDCRPEFYRAFSRAAAAGTKAGQEGNRIRIETPLINMGKSDIVLLGLKLKVPFELTWSCYRGAKRPCAKCDSCYFRAKGFEEAGIKDPALIQ